MKMIKPLQNVMDLATNDAPMDAYSEWSPEGRDLLEYLDAPIFDVVGDTLIAVSSTGGKIYKVVLSTGVVTQYSYTVGGVIRNIKISPNELYFAITWGGLGQTSFIEISTGSLKLYDEPYVKDSSYTDAASPYSRDGIQWSSDSTVCYFISYTDIKQVVVPTFVSSVIFSARPFSSLLLDGLHLYAFIPYYNGKPSQIYRGLFKITLAGAQVDLVNYDNHYVLWVRKNPSRDTILLIGLVQGGSIQVLEADPSDLNDIGLVFVSGWPYPNVNYNVTSIPYAIKTTATHLITRSVSTAPYWNYRLLTDYSLDKSLPALPDKGEGIAVGTDYTAVQQSQGFGLILNADDSIISQQNPNVTEGDTFIYDRHIYEALTNNNDRPDTGASLATPTWLDRGFINPLRMFDGKLDSVTTAPGTLNVSIAASSLIGALAVFNVEAATIQVKMTDPTDGLVYDSGLIDMQGGNSVDNWFDYFFAPYIPKSDYAIIDFPAYPEATIAVEMVALNGTVKLGELVLGRTYDLGIAQYGTSVGIIDFSRKETDDFGNFKIVERRFSKRAEYDIKVDSRRISAVQRTLADMRAEPAVYIGDIMREETIIYGFFRSFDIVISAPSISDATITVEGL